MTNKEVFLYFLEQCWYGLMVYWFVVFLKWYTHQGLDLWIPWYFLYLLLMTLLNTVLQMRIEDKKQKHRN